MDVFGLLVVVVIAAIIAAVLLGVNSRRVKRGEPLRNPSAAVAAIAFLVAALVMLMVAINLEIPWAVAMSGVSVAGTLPGGHAHPRRPAGCRGRAPRLWGS